MIFLNKYWLDLDLVLLVVLLLREFWMPVDADGRGARLAILHVPTVVL